MAYAYGCFVYYTVRIARLGRTQLSVCVCEASDMCTTLLGFVNECVWMQCRYICMLANWRLYVYYGHAGIAVFNARTNTHIYCVRRAMMMIVCAQPYYALLLRAMGVDAHIGSYTTGGNHNHNHGNFKVDLLSAHTRTRTHTLTNYPLRNAYATVVWALGSYMRFTNSQQ